MEMIGYFNPNPAVVYECLFNSLSAAAVLSGHVKLECIAPSLALVGMQPSIVPLAVRINGADVFVIPFTFEYYESPLLLRIQPSVGGLSGGLLVSIYGNHFHEGTHSLCQFGEAISSAYFVSENLIQCVVPPSSYPGDVIVSYSINGVDFVESDLKYSYISGPAVVQMQPTRGSIYGGTIVTISTLDVFQSQGWFCAFGQVATRAVNFSNFSNAQLQCATPASPFLSSGPIDVSLVLLPNVSADSISIDTEQFGQVFAAAGSLTFIFVEQLVLTNVSPSVLFVNTSASVMISVETEILDGITCVWEAGFIYSTPAYWVDGAGLSCLTPIFASEGRVDFTLSCNGFVETDSVLEIEVVASPLLLSALPSRIVGVLPSDIVLTVDSVPKIISNITCGFFLGSQLLHNTSASIDLLNEKVHCSAPNSLPHVPEVQKIYFTGPPSAAEVQSIVVSFLPNQPEVQRIEVSAWGTQDAVFDLRIAASVPSAYQGRYILSTQASLIPDIKVITLQSSPFVAEVQSLQMNAIIQALPSNDGIMFINFGAANFSMYWNSTGGQLATLISSSTELRNVTALKTSTQTQYAPGLVNISNAWTITFGSADGNVPQLRITGYQIPSAVKFRSIEKTLVQGVACDLHAVDVVGANQGNLAFTFMNYTSITLPLNSSASRIRQTVLASFPPISEVIVEVVSLSSTGTRFLFYFVGNAGPQPQIGAVDAGLSDSIYSSGNISGGSLVQIVSTVLVRSTVPPLSGTLGIGNSMLAFFGVFNVSMDPYNLPSALPFINSSEPGQLYSPYSFIWQITFQQSLGLVSTLQFDLKGVVGLNPSVIVRTEQMGTGADSQSLLAKCVNGATIGSSFSLGLGNRQAGDIPTSSSASQLLGYLSSWTFLSVSQVSVNVSASLLSISITVDDAEVTSIGEFYLGGIGCSDGSQPMLSTNRSREGRFAHLTGSFTLSTGQSSVSLSSDASSADIQSAFLRLGYGAVDVNRSLLPFGAYSWNLTFLESTSDLSLPTLDTSLLRSLGAASAMFQALASPALSCCISEAAYTLKNICKGNQTQLLSNDFLNQISAAFSQVSGIQNSSFAIDELDRPAGGKSFYITVNGPITPNCIIVDNISPLSTKNTTPVVSVSFDTITPYLAPQIQRILIKAFSEIEEYFDLEFQGRMCSNISVNVPASVLETSLKTCFSLEQLSVYDVMLPLSEYSGDYRAWDVVFISSAGDNPLITCDISAVRELYTASAHCFVTIVNNSTSSALGGSFTLNVPGFPSISVPYNVSAAAISSALESLLDLPVQASRYDLEPDGGAAWEITFLADRGSEQPIGVSSQGLTGTNATVSVTVVQNGSFLYGNYSLSFGGGSSSVVQFDASAEEIEAAISALSPLVMVSVALVSELDNYREYSITFESPSGDVPVLQVDSSNIIGSSATVVCSEKIKGIDKVLASFSLRFGGESTIPLNQDTTAEILEAALEALSGIGDVSVERFSGADPSWAVTFTTLGNPVNAGEVPLLQVSELVPVTPDANVIAARLQSGCCDIRLAYNDNYQYSSSSIGVVVDSSPLVSGVSPYYGSISGGVNVSISGSGFSDVDGVAMCLFGAVSTPAVVLNQSFAHCISPAQSSGAVILTLKLNGYGSGLAQGVIARSASVFYVEAPPVILLLVPSRGLFGQITNVSVNFNFADVSATSDLSCNWSVSTDYAGYNYSMAFTKPCFSYNASICDCETPSLADMTRATNGTNNFSNRTSAAAKLSLSRNLQQLSNAVGFLMYSEPHLVSLAPPYGFRNNAILLEITGEMFPLSGEAWCSVGDAIFEAQIISASVLTCNVGELQPKPTVYTIRLLYPLISHSVQSIELFAVSQSPANVLYATFRLELEGYLTAPLSFNMPIENVTAAISALPRVGNVSVEYAVSQSLLFFTGVSGSIFTWRLTFLSREDDVPQVAITDVNLKNFSSGDSLTVRKIANGGADGMISPDIQQWGFAVDPVFSEIQVVEISGRAAILEVQIVTVNSTRAIQGFFALSYSNHSSVPIAHDASSDLLLASIRDIPSVGDLHLSRIRQLSYGYTWLITFLNPGNHSRFQLNNVSLESPGFIHLETDVLVKGVDSLSGTYTISYNNSSTGSLSIYETAEVLQAEFKEKLLLENVTISRQAANSTLVRFLISFAPSYGAVNMLEINSMYLNGTDIATKVTRVQKGSILMEGTYSLNILGEPLAFSLNSSLFSLQQAIRLKLYPKLGGLVPLVDQIENESFRRSWRITFPLSVGDVPLLSLNDLNFNNPNTSVNVSKFTNGSYHLLSGNFSLAVNNVTLPPSIPYNASASLLQQVIAGVQPYPTPIVTRDNSPVVLNGQLFDSISWTIYFDGNATSPDLVPPSITLGNSSLNGHTSLDIAIEESGQGPDFQVEVSFDGQHFTNSQLVYHAVEPMVLLEIFPREGPASGGTRIAITIAPISEPYYAAQLYPLSCVFNDTYVSARVTSTTSVECMSPPYPLSLGGTSFLSLSLNGQDAAIGTFEFTYLPLTNALSITPPFGVITGGTAVNISGSSIRPSRHAFCSFNGIIVNATSSGDGYLICKTPQVNQPLRAYVTFTLNSQDYVPNTGLFFDFVDAPIASVVLPPSGAVGGGTSVKITGQNFVDSSMATCMFGDAVVPAVVSSPTSMSCTTPALLSEYEVQEIDVGLVPFQPPVLKIHAFSTPAIGSSLTINISAEAYRPRVEAINFSVASVDLVQRVTVGSNIVAATVAKLSVRDYAQQNDVQVLHTVARSVPEIQYVIVKAPYTTLFQPSYNGLAQAVQEISIVGPVISGYFRLGDIGAYSANIPWNASAALMESILSSVSTLGIVTVTNGGPRSWLVTCVQRLGPVPLLSSLTFFSDPSAVVLVQQIVIGSSIPISGSYMLSFGGLTSIQLYPSSTAPEVQSALQSLPGLATIQVSRVDLINNGFMLGLHFPEYLGDVPPVTIVNNLTGTLINAAVVTQQDGDLIRGSFVIYSFDLWGNSISTPPLSFDSSSNELATALESLNPAFRPLLVQRTAGSVTNTYSWSITIPAIAGAVSLLNVDAADLKGPDAGAYFVKIQEGRVPSVIKVSTQGSSAVSGSFRLNVDGYSTFLLPADASAEEVKLALESLPSVGEVAVSRNSTGSRNFASWDPLSSTRLSELDSLFVYDFNTYNWLITFYTRTGPPPVVIACCDELQSIDPSDITLVTQWTRDSQLLVSTLIEGTTPKLDGKIALTIAGRTTDFFPLSATSVDVQYLLERVGMHDVTVSRSSADPNGFYNWFITFTDPSTPFVDAYLSPSLSVETYMLQPQENRNRVSLFWDNIQSAPMHCIQEISYNTGLVQCAIKDSRGQSHTVQFLGSDPIITVQAAFQSLSTTFGNITIVPGDTAKQLLVIFDSFVGFLAPMTCSNAAVALLQSSDISPLGGYFAIVVGPKSGLVSSTVTLPYNVSAQNFASALNGVLGNNAVVVNQEYAGPNEYSWLITFAGIAGSFDLLQTSDAYLNGTNAFASTTILSEGSYLSGTLKLLSAMNTSLVVLANASASDLEFQLSIWLDVSNVSISVQNYSSGSSLYVYWLLSYYLTSPLSYVTGFIPMNLSGVVFTTLDPGSISLAGDLILFSSSHISQAAVTIPVQASASMIHSLSSVLLQGYYSVSVESQGANLSWIFLFSYGHSLPNISFNSSGIIGTNVNVGLSQRTTNSSALGGSFTLAANSQSQVVSVNSSTEDLQLALAALGFPNSVTASFLGLTNFEATWLVTFGSLQYADHLPQLLAFPSSLTGDAANVSVGTVTDGAWASIYEVSLQGNVTDAVVGIHWDSVFISNIFLNSSSNSSSPLPVSNRVTYATYETINSTTGLSLYILIVPSLFSPLNESLLFNASSGTTRVYSVNLYARSNLNNTWAGQLALSLGNIDCLESISGISCPDSTKLEFTPFFNALSTEDSLIRNLESLRNVIQVAVSASPLHGFVNSLGYVLLGIRYRVTFVQVIQNITGDSVYDRNELTWLPENAFPVSRRLAALPTSQAGGVLSPITPTQIFSLPNMIADSSSLSKGWEVSVHELVRGSDNTMGAATNVSVSMNGQDYSVGQLLFTYEVLPEVTVIIPDRGPLLGGTEVLVIGSNFVNGLGLSCGFSSEKAGIVSVATVLNSSAIICISPPRRFSGDVSFYVSNNGDFTSGQTSTAQLNFTFDDNIQIFSFHPNMGQASGNTMVTIQGGPFAQTGGLRCKFGGVAVRAYFIDQGQIQCSTPPYRAGVYPLEVSMNEQDYSNYRLPFFFYDDLTIESVFPPSGPAFSAGTEVLVKGNGFVNSSFLTCKFGNMTTRGVFISSFLTLCQSPPVAPVFTEGDIIDSKNLKWMESVYPVNYFYPEELVLLVSFEVSNNGEDFTSSGLTFLYQADSIVTGIYPNGGFVGEANPFIVTGYNFVNSTFLRCRVGANVVNATFLSREAVLCFTPRYPLLKTHHPFENKVDPNSMIFGSSVVYVEVANNGQDFSNDRFTYDFQQICLSGYYCPELNSVPCPPGSYCPGTFNLNYTLCPKGTYNPYPAQWDCFRCPIGFICPEEGMHVPRICPAGFVCEFTGIAVADNPCPEGHYCLEGTATSATTCGYPTPSSSLFPILSHAERQTTLRAKRIADGLQLYLGSRKSGCWSNDTADFGFQASAYPARFWSERHMLPLATDSSFIPSRGRYCLDDSCMRLADESSYLATDYAFDYSASSYSLRRPIPCPPGVYCHPGTSDFTVNVHNFTTPQPCSESMYCPEASAYPFGKGECPVGFYCPFGIRLLCPVGTYCPREGQWEPSPCMPGTFNGQVGVSKCTPCDRGYICPGFGRVAPALCPAGYICSKQGLAAPNFLCLAGFYCSNGTTTADPLRNDTTLRPYPCSPGTYCLSGVGNNSVVKGNFFFAQPCQPGFYCESASATAKGSGLCPSGFICPEGTATPIPAPKGNYAPLQGLTAAIPCLPGYYAPTIESKECYPCPPGTSCENEGTIIADLCPPGTYRGDLGTDGVSCISCPQGYWSKNYGLREAGECIKCPTGMICPVAGMTTPCSAADLPSLYEPVINYLGTPTPQYMLATTDLTVYYDSVSCLNLNPGYSDGTMTPEDQQYFFGELVPPYIDILGRGPNFRTCDSSSTKFQTTAKCYQNTNPLGSPVYQRMADYYGPMYDIQFGIDYQGYGLYRPNGTYYYDGFFNSGSMYIDLPHARNYEASYNCTKGFVLMNASQIYVDSSGLSVTVYTDADYYPGGNVAIQKGADVFYPGTCEADRICYIAAATGESSQAAQCAGGFLCDERTTAIESNYYPCRAGYACHSGTTPDPDIAAPQGQFTKLCPAGYYCQDGTSTSEQFSFLCPANYYCPTGTGDPWIGSVANDALNRGLSADEANPYLDVRFVRFLSYGDVRTVSRHDALCLEGVDVEQSEDYVVQWFAEGENLTNPYIDYLRVARAGYPPYQNDSRLTGRQDSKYYRPSVINSALNSNLRCGRDHKWRLINETISRQECDCLQFFNVLIAVYRLWKCTSDGFLEPLGEGSVLPAYSNGGRDYWFPRSPVLLNQCTFPTAINVTLTTGAVFETSPIPSIGPISVGLLNLSSGLQIQFTWGSMLLFRNYTDLRNAVYAEWTSETQELYSNGNRTSIDPFVFNVYRSVGLIEEYGEVLEDMVWLIAAADQYGTATLLPNRLDICECQNIYKCPNGTVSTSGSSKLSDCTVPNTEVLRRIGVIPSWVNESTSGMSGKLANLSDFTQLTGYEHSLQPGLQNYPLGSLTLLPLDVAIVTLDLKKISHNLTYGSDYRISAYVDCKPCPTRYQCQYSPMPVPTCSSPSLQIQNNSYYQCLNTYKIKSCLNSIGAYIDCSNSTGEVVVEFMEPDLFKCRQIPYFCDGQSYEHLVWNVMKDKSGYPLNASMQESSWYIVDPTWNAGQVYQYTPGCCSCESHWLPYYFYDSIADTGYPDNKHTYIQLSFEALDSIELTVALELLNGQFYIDFDLNVINIGDVFIHTPSRAQYTPAYNPRAAFLAVIDSSLYGNLLLPLNLPMETVRIPGQPVGGAAGTTTTQFEYKVLLGRTSNLYQADPDYITRYEERMQALYNNYTVQFEYRISELMRSQAYLNGSLNLPNMTSFADFARVPNLKEISASLYPVPDPLDQVYVDINTFWGYPETANGFLGLPYFPYFSNCQGAGRFISIAKTFETDPNCALVPYDKTVPVVPLPWQGSTVPYSDKCLVPTPESEQTKQQGNTSIFWLPDTVGVLFQCEFEEAISVTPVPLTFRWFEASLGTTLFYITNIPIVPDYYSPIYTQDVFGNRNYLQYWGQSNFINNMLSDPSQALPVHVGDITGLLSGGLEMVVPRQVRMQIRYYQVNQGTKRIVNGNIEFLEAFRCFTYTGGSLAQQALEQAGIPQCDLDINGNIASSEYQLEIQFYPLQWYTLLNVFQFTWPIYIIFFFFTGLATIAAAVAVYILNRLLTRLRYPPQFHGVPLLYAVGFPSVFGCILGSGAVFIPVIFVWWWLTPAADGGIFCSQNLVDPASITPYCFENIAGSWQGLGDEDTWRNGRKGVALISIGFCAAFVSARLLNPLWTDEERRPEGYKESAPVRNNNIYVIEDEDAPPPSRVFRPQIWKRANWGLMFIVMLTIMMAHIEFSYSTIFGLYTNEFILIFVIIYFCLEHFLLEPILGEDLVIVPIMGATDIMCDIVTMGASNFINFLLSYVAQNIVLAAILMLFANQAAVEVIKMAPRWYLSFKRRFRFNKRMTREMKAREEMEWRRINEELEMSREGIEPLLESLSNYASGCINVAVNPFSFTILYMFYTESQIASNYFVLLNEIAYFIGFPGFIIPFKFISDVFYLNTLELMYGWKLYDYIAYLQYRFTVREHRWILRNTILDESITEEKQTIDLMCFSSQFYYICGLNSFAMIVIVVGITILERWSFNPFADPITPVIVALMIILCSILRVMYMYLADIKIRRLGWRGLWMTRQIEGTIDDEVAAKLAVGVGRQEDLERERLELQALNSDRFRHKFLERNRPWILQHLVELLTPRSLETPGPDGRPTVEYVRDVYAELLAMGEGMRRPGERQDISDDEEDELEAARRNWTRKALTGASLAIAKLWLAKARKRRAFSKLVKGIIEQHKKVNCDVCGRNPELHGVRLQVFLATDGAPDNYAIDRLIGQFEYQYGENELDPILWKAFFRAHAEYCTRCNICLESAEQVASAEGKTRLTRPQDISSDEDEDEVLFEPLVVSRTSNEGRMMSKWLTAARKKLGGTFPRPQARKEMDRYANKLKQLKMKRARIAAMKAAGLHDEPVDQAKKAEFSMATRALAIRWLRKARENMISKFRGKTDNLRDELESVLKDIREEDDWYFGGEMRLEGATLLAKGNELEDDRRALEAEAAVKIHKIQDDLKKYVTREEAELAAERRAFEAKLSEINGRIDAQIEARNAELLRSKELKRAELEQIERTTKATMGALSSELVQRHAAVLSALDAQMVSERAAVEEIRSAQIRDARVMFDKTDKIRVDEISRRKLAADDSCARIRQELSARLRATESEWQSHAIRWVTLAKRKVEVKKREDAEALATKRRRKGEK